MTVGLGVAGPVRATGDEAWPAVHEYLPAPALVAAATQAGVLLEGIETAADAAAAPHAEDTVVLFVALDQRVRQSQWLVRLRGPIAIAAPAENEPFRDTVLYGMDGRAIRFPARRETYAILSIGPFESDDPKKPLASREIDVPVNAAFLDERLDRAASFMLRTGRARRTGALGVDELFTVLPSAPNPPDAAARERFVAAAGLTDDDERAVAATVPMLSEFARVIAGTPGLRDVLFSVVDRPSVWSVLSRFGRLETYFQFRSGGVVPSVSSPVGFAGIGPCYSVPFTFSVNDRAALDCTMLVAEPRVPLRLCGGIVAVVADSPARSDVRLIVRVLAARSGSMRPAQPATTSP